MRIITVNEYRVEVTLTEEVADGLKRELEALEQAGDSADE